MKLQLCKQMMTIGLTLVVLAAVARLSPLTSGARMADSMALIASGTLVVLAAAVGWHERRREQDAGTSSQAFHPRSSDQGSRMRAHSADVDQHDHR